MGSVLTATSAEVVLGRVAVPAENLEGWVEHARLDELAAKASVQGALTAPLALCRAASVDVIEGQVREVGNAATGAQAAVDFHDLAAKALVVGQARLSDLLLAHCVLCLAIAFRALLWAEGLVGGIRASLDLLASRLVPLPVVGAHGLRIIPVADAGEFRHIGSEAAAEDG